MEILGKVEKRTRVVIDGDRASAMSLVVRVRRHKRVRRAASHQVPGAPAHRREMDRAGWPERGARQPLEQAAGEDAALSGSRVPGAVTSGDSLPHPPTGTGLVGHYVQWE